MKLRLLLIMATVIFASNYTMTMAQTKRGLSTDEQVLVGTQWESTSLVQGVGTLWFEEGGHVSGFAACNSYKGNYRVEGDRISFSQIISDKKECDDIILSAHEILFFKALNTATRFRLNSKQLTIYYDTDRGVLDFKKLNIPQVVPAQSDDPIDALNNYYRALNIGEARTAYKYWENPSQTYEQFINGFGDTMRVRILVEPSPQIEGAAGSSYAKVASVVVSTHRNGTERVFAGCYVMRRSNVRAEDDPDQKGWRIYSASLAPVAGKISTLLDQRCK